MPRRRTVRIVLLPLSKTLGMRLSVRRESTSIPQVAGVFLSISNETWEAIREQTSTIHFSASRLACASKIQETPAEFARPPAE